MSWTTVGTRAGVDTGGGGRRAAGVVAVVAGLVCAVVGVVVLAGWVARGTAALRWPGRDNPMVVSAAVAFAVTGAALVALSRGWRRWVVVAAGVDVGLGVLVIAGHVLGRGLGLDDLFVTVYLGGAADSGGRMGVNTAVCFVLAGVGVLTLAPGWPWPGRRAVVLAAAGSLIAAVAMLSLFGHAAGFSAAYGWGEDASMAVLTGATMVVLAVGMLTLTWQRTDRRGQWLAMPAGAVTLGAAVLVWAAVADRDQSIVSGTARAVAVLAVFTAGLVAFAVWMALRAENARHLAVASQTRLFQFLDALPVAVSIRTGSGRPYYANDEAERLLGASVHAELVDGDLPGLYQLYAQNTGQPYPARDTAHARAVRGEHAHLDDVEIHRPGGGVTALEVWGTPICGPAGAVDYTIAAFADVSERKAAERALADQASLLDLAHDAILVRDAGQVISFWNRGAERTYGFTRGEAVGQVASGLLRTEYPAGDPDAELAGSGSWQGELVQTRRDGRRIVLASRWAARLASDGTRVGVMEVNRDITAARDAQRYARSLIEASQDPLLVINPTGTITDVNQAAIREVGVPGERIIGTDFAGYFTAPHRARDGYRRALADGVLTDCPLAIRRPGGEVRDVLVNASLYRDTAGTVLGVVATAHDITDRRRAERERALHAIELEQANSALAQSNAALARSNAELEQFAYAASHDLSEPLRAISRPLALLARRYHGRLDERADEFIGFAVDGCQRMQHLIDGLLAFSRVGRPDGDTVPTDAGVTLRAVLGALGPTLDDAHATVTVDPLPVVMAEPTQLAQVFQNLIGNAVKFTAPGTAPRITVTAERTGAQCRFTVTDNGIGIDPEHRERIFGMFKRLHHREDYPGTGIGLALVKKIIEQHGGQVGVADPPAAATGTQFWFTLPAAPGTSP